jgi:hypothetical protein
MRRAVMAPVAVAGAWAAWRVARRAAPVAVAAAVVAVAGARQDWLDDIVDGAAGLLGRLMGWATGWIRRILRAVVDRLSRWVSGALDWISRTLAVLRRMIDAAGEAIAGVWRAAAAYARRLVEVASDGLRWLVAEARDAAAWALGQLRGFVERGLAWLTARVEGLASWVHDEVLVPLWREITGAVDWLRAEIMSWVTGLFDRIWDFTAPLRQWVVDRLIDMRDVILAPLRPVIDAVDRARGWLAWFAAHPIDAVRRDIDRLAGRSAAWAAGIVVDTVRREGRRVEEWVARWLG